MIFFAETHKGYRRPSNQDCFYIPQNEEGWFALVADGMGGHNGGEVASRIFLDTAQQTLEKLAPEQISEDVISSIFTHANTKIFLKAQYSPELYGMGTTATLAVFKGGNVLIGHVGDSRAYVYSGGALTQITKDHSYVQSLVDRGLISSEDAASHPQRNIILRAIGTGEDIMADISTVSLSDGDVLLLCTDGLFGCVTETQIAQILGNGTQQAAARLIEAALAEGGMDNITVAIAVFDGGTP